MLSQLLLQARDAESQLMNSLYEVLTHMQLNTITEEEDTLIMGLHGRLCKHGPTLMEALAKSRLKRAECTPSTSRHNRSNLGLHSLQVRTTCGSDIEVIEVPSPSSTAGSGYVDNDDCTPSTSRHSGRNFGPRKFQDSPTRGPEFEVIEMPSSINFDNVYKTENNFEDEDSFASTSQMESLINLKMEPVIVGHGQSMVLDANYTDKADGSLTYEFAPGQRYQINLLYVHSQKQLFRRKCCKEDYEAYVCNISNCKAKLKMIGDLLYKPHNYIEHKHADQETKYLTNMFRLQMRQELEDNPGASYQKLFDKVIKSNPVGGTNTDSKKLRKTLKNIRKAKVRRSKET